MFVEAVFNTGLHSVGAIFALLFTTIRVVLWAFLVATAWYEIIEKPFEKEVKKRAQQPKTTDPSTNELAETALEQHQAAEAVYKLEKSPGQQGPGNIPRSSGRNAMADEDVDESIDRWSIWENESEPGQPHTPPGARPTQERLIADPTPSVPGTRYPSVSSNVARPPVQVIALEEQTGGKKRSGGGGSAGKKPEKPFVNRKLEKYLVEPYEKQCTISSSIIIYILNVHAGYLAISRNPLPCDSIFPTYHLFYLVCR